MTLRDIPNQAVVAARFSFYEMAVSVTPPAAHRWEGSNTATTHVASIVLELLRQLFIIEDPTTVFTFLRRHPFLGSLLLEAHTHIRAEFGPARTFLKIFVDPEDPRHQQLTIVIAPRQPPREAVAVYRHLQQNWWAYVLPLAQGALAITLEYR